MPSHPSVLPGSVPAPAPSRSGSLPPPWARRVLALVVTAVSTAGLLAGPATPASAGPAPTPPCPGPGQTIMELQTDDPYVAVGTTKTQQLRLDLVTHAGCDATGATATVRTPGGNRTVTLRVVRRDVEQVLWRGTLAISPRSLRNSDAGAWRTTYRVTGGDPDRHVVESHVRRAVRLSFNAGPEPVRGSRITYSGHLERASWATRTYRDLAGRQVSIVQVRLDEEDQEELAAATTRADGTFRLTRRYAGPGYYLAVYEGTRYTSGRESRRDRVDTPR